MESSPLTKAHDHAHAAAVATRQTAASDTTVAISEHAHAAGEFANAARNTSSVEALRTLKLLEEHHRRLAEILRLPPDAPLPQTSSSTSSHQVGDGASEKDGVTEKAQQAGAADDGAAAHANKDMAVRRQQQSKPTQMPGLSHQRRVASREMSSSIASNLASARGIKSKYRGQPLSPSVSNDQAPGNVDPHPRRDGSRSKMQSLMDHQVPGKPTWVPPVGPPQRSEGGGGTASATSPPPEAASAVTDDAGYTRFYNSFGSLISKISAPLAFAGLPLIQEEPVPPSDPPKSPEISPVKLKPKRSPSTVSAEPDLSKIYSKATMRALAREGHSANDSFYVVPTSGHTMSYANILTYAEKEKRRLEASSSHGEGLGDIDEDEDDFVDAREAPTPLSSAGKRRMGRPRSDKQLQNTVEELSMENKSLKDMLDKLTKRLHAFEASAQMPAMAIAESYRAARPGSPLSPVAGPNSGGGGSGKGAEDAATARRKTQEMEEQLSSTLKQMERLEKDNRKMQKTLDKYREKWEALKAGAKARREAQGTPDPAEEPS